jgi:hypothetical protein
MKKFLAVFDGYKMSRSTIEYSIQLSQKAHAHLVGVFLDEFFYHSYSFYNIISTQKDYQEVFKNLDAKDARKRDEAVQQFQKAVKMQKLISLYTGIRNLPSRNLNMKACLQTW